MGRGKLWLFLVIIFIFAYWWASGNGDHPPQLPPIGKDSAVVTAWQRVYRVFDLKSAVRDRIDLNDYTRLRDTPLPLQQAIIAVEDNRFYSHSAIDVEGIIRASLVNLQTGSLEEGGSTITQQLVKNLFLTQDKTWGRKFEEIVLAFDMEQRYSKEEILEIYLNTIYFGSGAKGINQAASVYFDKSPAQLSLAECAMLAGLPNAPSLYSPYVNYTAAKHRQAVVLDAMVRYGYIGPELAREAKDAPLKFAR